MFFSGMDVKITRMHFTGPSFWTLWKMYKICLASVFCSFPVISGFSDLSETLRVARPLALWLECILVISMDFCGLSLSSKGRVDEALSSLV